MLKKLKNKLKGRKDDNSDDLLMQDIYDLLMFPIEPELTTDMIPELDHLYKDETPEQRKERAERYAHAYEVFQDRFDEFTQLWKGNLRELKEEIMNISRQSASQSEAKKMASLERSFDES